MKGMSSLSMSAQRRRLRGTMMASLPAAGLCFSGKVTKGLVCPGSGRTRSFGRERFGPCPRGQEIADFPNGDGGFWLPSRDSNPDHRLPKARVLPFTPLGNCRHTWKAWCRRPDSNRHGLSAQRCLRPSRLPIPPLRLLSTLSPSRGWGQGWWTSTGGSPLPGRWLGHPSGDPGAYGRRSRRVT